MAKQLFKPCASPCPRYLTGGDTHELCVVCLGVEHALSAFEETDCPHCEKLSLRMLRSRLSLFDEKSGEPRAPQGAGPASAEAERRMHSWGSQMDLSAGLETGPRALSPPLPGRSIAQTPVSEARPAASSARGESPLLRCSSSEELDVTGSEGDTIRGEEDSPSLSPAYEELVDVLTRAVDKLHISWPSDKQSARPKSKLDERFLSSKTSPTSRGLPFFPDLHSELSRSWNKPYSSRLFSPQVRIYSDIRGLKENGYEAMPRAEQTLASYLSPGSASSIKNPTLPTKPLKITSNLVGKAYTAAGQAGACLHSMALLQAYQAELLGELDNSEGVSRDEIRELRRATDLSLRATKETARAIGRSMAALVSTERHLWLNLSDIKDKDRSFLLDAPISHEGLFGDAVNEVVERFQENKKQSEAFKSFLPRRSNPDAAGRARQPQPSCSSYRVFQKESVASRAPPQKSRGPSQHSQPKQSKQKPDLRTVLLAKKASAQKKRS